MKKTKAEVDYGVGHKLSHCGPTAQFDTGYCKFFNTPFLSASGIKYGNCEKIVGPVQPMKWCKLWQKAKS